MSSSTIRDWSLKQPACCCLNNTLSKYFHCPSKPYYLWLQDSGWKVGQLAQRTWPCSGRGCQPAWPAQLHPCPMDQAPISIRLAPGEHLFQLGFTIEESRVCIPFSVRQNIASRRSQPRSHEYDLSQYRETRQQLLAPRFCYWTHGVFQRNVSGCQITSVVPALLHFWALSFQFGGWRDEIHNFWLRIIS